MAASNLYSRVVAWTKVILPLLALALLSTLFLFSRTPDPELAIPFATVDVEELAREQRLTAPRFAGTLTDGREVVFTAESAAPVMGEPNQISARTIDARIDLGATDRMIITAAEALIDLELQVADMGGEIRMNTSGGFALRTGALSISLADFEAISPGEITVTGPGLELVAGEMTLSGTEGAHVLVFNNGVRMLYHPQN